MKIIVIGAGAMGCLYGAYLSKHNDVTMLDVYEPQVENINQNGITVLEEDGTEQHFSGIRAMKSGTCKEVADLSLCSSSPPTPKAHWKRTRNCSARTPSS